MENEIKIWELVKAIEEDSNSAIVLHAHARSTMLANFGKDAPDQNYAGIINEGDNLGYMIVLGFKHMHCLISDKQARINELETWLQFLLRFAPDKQGDKNLDIKQIVLDILNKNNAP